MDAIAALLTADAIDPGILILGDEIMPIIILVVGVAAVLLFFIRGGRRR